MHSRTIFIFLFAFYLGYLSVQANTTTWNKLQVKWGVNASQAFFNMPTTVQEALADGFTKLSDCDPNAAWRGARYIKNNDLARILLFDVKGYIAGIQSALPNNLARGYPTTALQPPFVKDGDYWLATVYFSNPSKICTSGRSRGSVRAEKVGCNLYIQNSTSPNDSILIPRLEKNIAGTKWVEGLCFPTMGKHYWWNFTDDMNCDTTFPFFLLYNDGQLVAFGFVFAADLSSPIYEHPPVPVISKFVKSVPTCLKSLDGGISTLHVYLTDYSKQIWC